VSASRGPGARRIAVLGAGVTGLAAAHRLVERSARRSPDGSWPSLELVVYEAAARTGGIVATAREHDLVLEDGPDSFVTDKPEARALCERLGLGPRLVGTRPSFRRSAVVAGERLVPVPAGFQLLAPSRLGAFLASPLLSPWGRARVALEPFVPARTRDPGAIVDESLGAFVRRRLGRELLERVAQPMVGGIYGADPERLSLLATFPRFLRLEAEYGSVVRGLAAAAGPASSEASGPRYSVFASLAGGIQELTDALTARLPAGALRLGTAATRLLPSPAGWIVETARGAATFDTVIVALPAPRAGALVIGFDPALAARLAALPRGSSGTVTFAFETRDIGHPRDLAGFVAPRREDRLVSGVSFADRKFEGRAAEGTAVLRAFVDERGLALDDDGLAVRVLAELARWLDLRPGALPRARRIVRWPDAMPHYEVGHLDRVREAGEQAGQWPGLFLAGHSYQGVGLPDCIRDGERAAEAAWAGTGEPVGRPRD
jgi:oxygen-dependent protoporphyrinogen oxidase